MSRATRRVAMFPRAKQRPKIVNLPDGQAERDIALQLRKTPTAELIAGLNRILSALEARGVDVRDLDHKERKLYRVSPVKGKYYFLAASESDVKNGYGG